MILIYLAGFVVITLATTLDFKSVKIFKWKKQK